MATISTTVQGDPEIGFRHENGKWRVLIGWRHTDDTDEGLKKGKLWCWVSSRPEAPSRPDAPSRSGKLQIFDEEYNRSPNAGKVRFCGVANFTMVRMFHPYFTINGRVPEDMVFKDKKICREQYRTLIVKHRLAIGLPVDDGDEQVEQANSMANAESVQHIEHEESPAEARLPSVQSDNEDDEVEQANSMADAEYVQHVEHEESPAEAWLHSERSGDEDDEDEQASSMADAQSVQHMEHEESPAKMQSYSERSDNETDTLFLNELEDDIPGVLEYVPGNFKDHPMVIEEQDTKVDTSIWYGKVEDKSAGTGTIENPIDLD